MDYRLANYRLAPLNTINKRSIDIGQPELVKAMYIFGHEAVSECG